MNLRFESGRAFFRAGKMGELTFHSSDFCPCIRLLVPLNIVNVAIA